MATNQGFTEHDSAWGEQFNKMGTYGGPIGEGLGAIGGGVSDTVFGKTYTTDERPGFAYDWREYSSERNLGREAEARQNAAYQMYLDAFRGQGPSLAREQMQQGQAMALSNAMSNAAQSRGGAANQALAARAGASALAQQAGQSNQQFAQIRAQEQMQARDQMTAMANQQRADAHNAQLMALQRQQGEANAYTQLQGINAQIAMGNAENRTKNSGILGGVSGGVDKFL